MELYDNGEYLFEKIIDNGDFYIVDDIKRKILIDDLDDFYFTSDDVACDCFRLVYPFGFYWKGPSSLYYQYYVDKDYFSQSRIDWVNSVGFVSYYHNYYNQSYYLYGSKYSIPPLRLFPKPEFFDKYSQEIYLDVTINRHFGDSPRNHYFKNGTYFVICGYTSCTYYSFDDTKRLMSFSDKVYRIKTLDSYTETSGSSAYLKATVDFIDVQRIFSLGHTCCNDLNFNPIVKLLGG